jgi:hypothetical protein
MKAAALKQWKGKHNKSQDDDKQRINGKPFELAYFCIIFTPLIRIPVLLVHNVRL